MANIIDNILAEVCLDDRIPNGIFDMSNPLHMEALFENLTDQQNIPVNDARVIHNKMVEGKYPERQAYNRDGLLVTFPTPQHKAKAVARGTHFEQDPTKGPANVFGGGQKPAAGQPAAPAPAEPKAPAAPPAAGAQPSALPASDTKPEPEPAAAAPGQSAPSSLPQSAAPAPAPAAPAPQAPGQPALAVEPQAAPGAETAPAPPPNFDVKKTPERRAAEAEVVKQIMSGDATNQTLPLPQTMPDPHLTEMMAADDPMKIMRLILQYATYAKGTDDPKIKQTTLVTIEAMASRFLKKTV